ncbi:uncharacterized protein [Prorops nasuta]|uniref:uncharacterized protein n=1 Tax=Prorops nasuta TaxID=863751 RepID=UPI0034CF9BBB
MLSFSRSCKSKARLVGKTVVITGANVGIGKETARDFYRRGARVILACRDLKKANEAAEDIKNALPSKPQREQFKGEPGVVKVCKLNLCSLSSVRECAAHLLQTEPTIDILVNNAGIMMCPYQLTEDGFETQFQTNHLGHFLLTLLLLPNLKAATPSRIVNVSAKLHIGQIDYENLNSENHYSSFGAYNRSKLANILFTKELAHRLKEASIDGITVYALHPGVISTELGRHVDSTWFRGARAFFYAVTYLFIKTPEQGAQTTIYCSLDEEAGKETGEYYQECAKTTPSSTAQNKEKAAELWNKSCEMLGIKPIDDLNEFLKTCHSQLLKPSKYNEMLSFSCSCKSKARLVGKTIVITGANIGIGKEAARDFYRRGARVILACRDLNKANAAAEDIKTVPPSKPEREQFKGEPGEIKVCKLNLSSLSSVRECAAHLLQTEPTIDILVNNAGVGACPYQLTEDGFETQFQTNHLGHFLLTLLLLPKLKASPSSRIVNVSSRVHTSGHMDYENLNSKDNYSSLGAYARSKLANILFTKDLARRLKEANINGITVYALHPGVVNTELVRHLNSAWFRGARTLYQVLAYPFIKTPEQGAQTTIYCSIDEEAGKESGEYYQDCAKYTPSSTAQNKEKAIELWNKSCEMLGIKPIEDINEFLKSGHNQLLNLNKK